MQLALDSYQLVKLFPKEEEYGLKSQVRRASVSIASNIAEGCSRSSQKEYKHFLEIALGSAFEVETDFILSCRLGMISEGQLEDILPCIHILQRRINTLISKIIADL